MPHEETFPSLRPNGSNTVWATILHLAARHAYPAGYPLDLIGAALTDFYYIEKGRLLITYTSQNGRERPILTIEHGNLQRLHSSDRVRQPRLAIPLPR